MDHIQTSLLKRLIASNQFSEIDLALARLLARLERAVPPAVLLASALVSRSTGEGHVCLPLSKWAGREIAGGGERGTDLRCPPLKEWLAQLKRSALVGGRGQWRPLILDGPDRLYLQRLYRYEQLLARHLRDRACAPDAPFERSRLRELLMRFFADEPEARPDWQKAAGLIAAKRSLCVISGGPGTGKTTTVAKILSVWIGMRPDSPPRIALCAPTGKAAARLSDAMQRTKASLPLAAAEMVHIPDQAVTIHRLLGIGRHGRPVRSGLGRLLDWDGVVVDEASMVDIVLMAQLVEALPPHARLLLLGDRDQLSSVEAGAIMGDLCRHAAPEAYSEALKADLLSLAGQELAAGAGTGSIAGPLNDSVVILQRNYRFRSDQGVGALAQGVNQGQAEVVKTLLRQRDTGLDWIALPVDKARARLLCAKVIEGFGPLSNARSAEEALARLNAFVVLCALREGPWGVQQMNRWVERQLWRAGLIDGVHGDYQGRPVMIIRNDYRLGLFNGDVGVTWNETGRSRRDSKVYFADSGGGLRAFPRQRLPLHQTAFAMTVHKSQGSEFDDVLLVLSEQDAPIFTRELLYTGVSRARRGVTLVAAERVLDGAVERRLERTSGLGEALWA